MRKEMKERGKEGKRERGERRREGERESGRCCGVFLFLGNGSQSGEWGTARLSSIG
jgi:hypothetical protein